VARAQRPPSPRAGFLTPNSVMRELPSRLPE
jgi:hypothetical protein